MNLRKTAYVVPFVIFLVLWGYFISGKRQLRADRDYYRRYHMASFEVEGSLSPEHRLVVFKNNAPVTGIGGRMTYRFRAGEESSVARFPIPWNAEEGFYEAQVFHPSEKERKRFRGAVFAVAGRKPKDVQFPLNAMNWENTRNLRTRRIPSPGGETGSWEGMFDWLDYMNMDTLFYLAGQTAYFGTSLPGDFPWIEGNLRMLDKVVEAAHERKKRIGAWTTAYIVVGNSDPNLNYTYGLDYRLSEDRLRRSRGISIKDPRRLKDIINVMRRIDTSAADFIGLDFIRPVQGGFELTEEFLEDMDIELPAHLQPGDERSLYLGREIFKNKNYALQDMWNWWRARQSSLAIEQIKEEVKSDKPLWAFVLSWQMGHQHGQDPVMFQDAGVDLQAVMLYECNTSQFNRLLAQWEKYNASGVNFIIGNQIDFNVHQFSEDPPAPEKFARRLYEAQTVFKPKGVFVNDLSRAFWGRKGPYTGKEWLRPVKHLIETGETGDDFSYAHSASSVPWRPPSAPAPEPEDAVPSEEDTP